MAKKNAKKKSMEPTDDVKRQILEKQLQGLQAKGYELAAQAAAGAAQDVGDPDGLKREVANIRRQSRNAYASARVIQGKLDALPEPEPESEETL